MNLAELRIDFLAELNRKDCTTDQANGYIAKALRRVQRECRLPCMELEATFEAEGESLSSILIPNDMIEPIDLFVPTLVGGVGGSSSDGESALTLTSYRSLQQLPLAGPVMGYARLGNKFYFKGVIPDGAYVKVVYYASGPDLEGDSTETAIMAAAPELVLYAALAYAGIFFEKPQAADWESAYQSTKAAVDQQARDLDASGGPMVIAPAYEA